MAAGTALAGPLAGRSVTDCLLVAAGTELCAAAAYLLTGSGRQVPARASPRTASTGAAARSHGSFGLMIVIFARIDSMQRAQWWPTA